MSAAARAALLALVVLAGSASAGPVPVPPDLPRYDLTLTIDVPHQMVRFRQIVTWTNTHNRPADCLTLNFYPHYRIPKGDRLLLAKTLELLRVDPDTGIDPNGRHGSIDQVCLGRTDRPLAFRYSEDNPTTFVVDLPAPVGPGQSVTVELQGTIRLPNKQGRWGQWGGVTYLTNSLPVLAFYDEAGWHASPFVPWHQPFWNEAGVYTATITLPTDQTLACSAAVASDTDRKDGWRTVVTKPFVGRDFAMLCSARYQEFRSSVRLPDGRTVTLRCLAFAHHAFYAEEMLRVAAEAIPAFSEWFGPFPYDQFTVAESFFGWNGNELGGMVMIDERIFDMPKLARGYVEYLLTHEICHQWWYNQVGTNGTSETFMDEGAATHFAHRLLDRKHGTSDNPLLFWPDGFHWLPNIKRDDYRWASWYGAVRRDEAPAAAGDLNTFGNLVALFTGAYDRGSKVYGMIEARLGPEFMPFIRALVRKYSFRVLQAADLKAELVAFCGPQSAAQWDAFFARWVYGNGLTDWRVDSVRVDGRRARRLFRADPLAPAAGGVTHRVEVVVSQHRELTEPTVVGFQFASGDGYPVRVPLGPTVGPVPESGCDAEIEPIGKGRFIVRATLPAEPVQVTVDPDRVIPDANPADNSWRRPVNVRVAPLYSYLHDTDLTTDWDRWNLNVGPWFWGPVYQDPWYTRATMLGARVGAYRTQTFQGGGYVAYRTDGLRDLVAGVDGLFDHWPFPKTQVGFNYERRIGGPYYDTGGRDTAQRATVFGRYIFHYTSSLYLYPMSYIDAFSTYQDNFLPFARTADPGGVRPSWTELSGLHYRLNLYTPYWDPDRGIWADVVAAGGVAGLGPAVGTGQLHGELAGVRKLPECMGYLSEVKVAGRVAAMGAFPDRGQFFALGGGTLFRGFDLAERQGSFLWAANTELRFPVVRNVRWNFLDNLAGVRNVTVAGFYDVGAVYTDGHAVGGVAHALGAGLRVDLAIFSFIERATVRLDVGKAVNAPTPVQFWFGVQNPF